MTLRDYLNRTLGTLEERLARMEPAEREAFESEAERRADVHIVRHMEGQFGPWDD